GTPAPASAPAASLVLLDSLQIPHGVRSIAWIVSIDGECHPCPDELGHLPLLGGPKEAGSVKPSVQGYASNAGGKFATNGTAKPAISAGPSTSTSPKPSMESGVAGRTSTLAIGTSRGEIQWYKYDPIRGSGNNWSRGGRSSASGPVGALRLLSTTTCGSSVPLAELHLLPASGELARGMTVASTALAAAAAAAPPPGTTLIVGGAGGLLAALQRADSALDWATSRNAVQIYDVATQRLLSTVRDPFESHQLVCCSPAHGTCGGGDGIGGTTVMDADPHVLLVGSVHGAICSHVSSLWVLGCARMGQGQGGRRETGRRLAVTHMTRPEQKEEGFHI
ncbi:hypothetical protein Vretimale_4300, partial [Volvox reticuliferus]